MSLYRREGSPYWWYSFNLDGERFRGSTGKEGKREAREVENERKAEAKRNRTRGREWTLNDALARYWSDHAKDKADSGTILTKLAKLREHLGSETWLSALTSEMMMEYRRKRKGEGLKPQSVNRDLAYLKAALNHAHNVYGKPPANIAWTKVRVAEPPGRIRFLSREEFDRLLAVAHPSIRPIIIFAVATGLRKENILSLTWEQVDMGAGIVTRRIKGNKEHIVRITPPLRAMLGTLGEREGAVFDRTNFRKRWDAALTAAKIPNFKFHDLRHTNASWARQAGADIADICDALGHSSVAVTMRYAHIQPEEHVTAFDRVSERLWSHSASQSAKKAGE